MFAHVCTCLHTPSLLLDSAVAWIWGISAFLSTDDWWWLDKSRQVIRQPSKLRWETMGNMHWLYRPHSTAAREGPCFVRREGCVQCLSALDALGNPSGSSGSSLGCLAQRGYSSIFLHTCPRGLWHSAPSSAVKEVKQCETSPQTMDF